MGSAVDTSSPLECNMTGRLLVRRYGTAPCSTACRAHADSCGSLVCLPEVRKARTVRSQRAQEAPASRIWHSVSTSWQAGPMVTTTAHTSAEAHAREL